MDIIEFNCPFCDNEMIVDSARSGERGKCPRCSSIIAVPEHMEFFYGDNFFEDEHLNELLPKFLEENESFISDLHVRRNTISFNMKMLTSAQRQNISLSIVEDSVGKWLLSTSLIAIDPAEDKFLKLLGLSLSDICGPRFALKLSKNQEGENLFRLACEYRLKDIDYDALGDMTTRLTALANDFESVVFRMH